MKEDSRLVRTWGDRIRLLPTAMSYAFSANLRFAAVDAGHRVFLQIEAGPPEGDGLATLWWREQIAWRQRPDRQWHGLLVFSPGVHPPPHALAGAPSAFLGRSLRADQRCRFEPRNVGSHLRYSHRSLKRRTGIRLAVFSEHDAQQRGDPQEPSVAAGPAPDARASRRGHLHSPAPAAPSRILQQCDVRAGGDCCMARGGSGRADCCPAQQRVGE